MHVAQSYELVTIYESLNIMRPTNESLGKGGGFVSCVYRSKPFAILKSCINI